MVNKITTGFVIQEFDDNGKCIHQEFVAGDQVDYENDLGEKVEVGYDTDLFHPFEMVQPIVRDEGNDGEYISLDMCKRSNIHLSSCDEDGFCNHCGHGHE